MVTNSTINSAWAVVLTSTNNYIKGVVALKHALHDLYHSQYPLLVLYTPTVVPEVVDILKKIGCIVKEIDHIHPMGKAEYKFERFIETWTKLAVWNQTEYERLVLLDADMLPLQNMDELMQLNLPNKNWVAASHACICNPQKIQHYPSFWIPENCSYTGCGKSACIEPSSTNNKADYFNSGLVVLIPDNEIFNTMITYLNSISDLNVFPFPDQDFLNEIFKCKWKPIPFTYNALKTLEWAHKPMWDIDYIKNIHYILTKPWDINLDQELSGLETVYKPLYRIWWNSYDQTRRSNINDIKKLENIISSNTTGTTTTTTLTP
jgi:alpha-N-acetylglucosamine transferase